MSVQCDWMSYKPTYENVHPRPLLNMKWKAAFLKKMSRLWGHTQTTLTNKEEGGLSNDFATIIPRHRGVKYVFDPPTLTEDFRKIDRGLF